MNKFTRFTLFAGLMAFGLAACGDDVQVVDPPPPPPPPLVVALQPGSLAINVGESQDIAVNVSGGDGAITPTVACSASNNAITVTTVGSVCRVVGVTEGGTATVTVVVEPPLSV
jgi:Fe2+ transport system protein FeoA